MRKLNCPFSDPAPLFRHGGNSVQHRQTTIDFSASLNPLGPPASVLRALSENILRTPSWAGGISAIAHYPDPGCNALAERLAAIHKLDKSQVVVGNGSNDLIYAVPRAFRPRRVAIAEPTYTEYFRASLLSHAEVHHWLAEGDSFPLQPFDLEGVDLVWLCHPNNPTGQLWPRRSLVPWMADNPRTLFVVDEAFLPFLPDEDEHSLVSLVNRFSNLVVLRSLTKIYCLPGLRLGYALAGPEKAERLRTQIAPWSVNGLAQIAGLAALEDNSYLSTTHAWCVKEREWLSAQLRDAFPRMNPLPSQASFLLVTLTGTTADRLTSRLVERGILIRDAANFIGLDNHYFRVAIRKREDNQRLVEALHTLYLEG